ncbi:signal transduction histidine kinase [Desulfosporosinus orientis DSM 765]|uniref:histidine kinase n=1 Tax=Desulfosporosinus orientis (strain ATCC 19365 / DSM 765 / NCIMB 8382 / VKM B-1628 / Singapore I) TaxID=768706 RepID=G7WCE1_DESOD|nr:HAMP domain-containing sensor histidine kinase [Desulfosporosinus orientis]AET66263.1 signal transduction histidine kinase [Desulfosporosinus orientis DSM 765]
MRTKLFLSTLLITLITLTLSMLSVNFVFKQQFSDYLTQVTETALEQLPSRLSAIYKTKGTWDSASLNELSYSLPMGTVVTLTTPTGELIATLNNPMEDMMHGQGGMGMNMNMNMGMSTYSATKWKTNTFTVTGSLGVIANVQVRYPASAQILNPQDVKFQSAVFRSLLLAGGLALLFGIFLSYFTSRRLVAPLKGLTQAANRIGHGQLEERVSIPSNDEVGQLAKAFNSMADNLNQQETLRKQFTADIAHELRTPLTSIKSYIEAFQDNVMPVDQENLAAIHEEIERLVDLSTDLKDLNVAEIGGLQLTLETVDLKDLLDKIVRSLYPLIQTKELTLNWTPPNEPMTLTGDKRLLARLLYNLVHNAYRYSNPGGQIIMELSQSNHQVKFVIRNTGMGISEEDLPFIFERFYRADKSRTRETGGTGIGLALVRQIINLHHGKINVQSKVGQETEFQVELPKEI